MGALKPWHIIVFVVVLVLLFGAKRLPDAARSLGRSLRIIKAETKGLVDDDNDVAEKAEPQYTRQPLHPSRSTTRASPATSRRSRVTSSRSTASSRRSRLPAAAAGPAVRGPGAAHQRPLTRTMAISLRRQGPSKFEQASDGSMTLIEHVRELRNRLFWASLGIVAGLIVGFIISEWVFDHPEAALLRAATAPGSSTPYRPAECCSFLRPRRRRPADPAAEDRAVGRPDRGRPGLAVPAVGVHRARPAPARAQVGVRLRGDRRAAVRRRRRAGLLRGQAQPGVHHGGRCHRRAPPSSRSRPTSAS